MEGTYKYDACIIINQLLTVSAIGRDLSEGMTQCEVNLTDPKDNTNGCSFGFMDDSEPTKWTETDVQIWVENYLQKYKQ